MALLASWLGRLGLGATWFTGWASLGDCLSSCNQVPGRVLDSEAKAAASGLARLALASSLRGDASKRAR